MQVFEFYFNPPQKNKLRRGPKRDGLDLIFDSFCYEPENIYEKRMGSLYVLGMLKNVLPNNVGFLDNLAKTIKDKFYRTISATPEKSFRDSLRKANEHLEKTAKSGDVSWLGNLSFGVISLRNFDLNFTKVGNLKIFLIRKGQIIDIDQKLKFDEIEPYPLKIFGNVVTGKLTENDLILALTEDVHSAFKEEKLLEKIALLSRSPSLKGEQKKIKEIFNGKKEKLSKISGICLLLILSKEAMLKEKETIAPPTGIKAFSFKEAFSPLRSLLKIPQIKKPTLPQVKLKIPELKIPKAKLEKPKIPTIKIPTIKIPTVKIPTIKIPTLHLNKELTIFIALAIVLVLGFFIFQKQEERQLKTYQDQLSQIEEKANRAENYLILASTNPQAEKEANALLKESWNNLSPLVKLSADFPSGFADEILALKNKIAENLYQLNQMVVIAEPELIFEFEPEEFVPQKIITDSENLYCFSPYSEDLFSVTEERIIETPQKFNLATLFNDSPLFFLKPNKLTVLEENQLKEVQEIQLPHDNSNFTSFSSYLTNLYFLDGERGEIVKYPYLWEFQWGSLRLWLSSSASDLKSISVDGSVWALTKENEIRRYYAGTLQEILNLDIFPTPEGFSKIFTSSALPYLYISEPVQKRIVIINKSGQIIKQFQSEKFDNLLDFTVSKNGRNIYLLNGTKIYKVEL